MYQKGQALTLVIIWLERKLQEASTLEKNLCWFDCPLNYIATACVFLTLPSCIVLRGKSFV